MIIIVEAVAQHHILTRLKKSKIIKFILRHTLGLRKKHPLARASSAAGPSKGSPSPTNTCEGAREKIKEIRNFARRLTELYHEAAMLSLRRIKTFVFARQASLRKQSFLLPRDSTWPPTDKGL